MMQHGQGQADGDPDDDRPVETVPVIDSHRLFEQGPEVAIRHKGQLYRLRITRNDKLILTK